MTKEKLAEIFRDWFNNFLTIERFAEYYGLSIANAERVIRIGHKAHEAGVIRYKEKKAI